MIIHRERTDRSTCGQKTKHREKKVYTLKQLTKIRNPFAAQTPILLIIELP